MWACVSKSLVTSNFPPQVCAEGSYERGKRKVGKIMIYIFAGPQNFDFVYWASKKGEGERGGEGKEGGKTSLCGCESMGLSDKLYPEAWTSEGLFPFHRYVHAHGVPADCTRVCPSAESRHMHIPYSWVHRTVTAGCQVWGTCSVRRSTYSSSSILLLWRKHLQDFKHPCPSLGDVN